MNTESQKKLYILIKKAVRDVIKEELSIILKESLSAVTNIISENSVNITKSKEFKPHISESREPIRSTSEVYKPPVKFNKELLKEMVGINSNTSSDPEFMNIGNEQVEQFINKYMGK